MAGVRGAGKGEQKLTLAHFGVSPVDNALISGSLAACAPHLSHARQQPLGDISRGLCPPLRMWPHAQAGTRRVPLLDLHPVLIQGSGVRRDPGLAAC